MPVIPEDFLLFCTSTCKWRHTARRTTGDIVHGDSEGETGGMTTKRIADRAGLWKCRVVGGCWPTSSGQDPKLGPCYKTRKEFARKVLIRLGRGIRRPPRRRKDSQSQCTAARTANKEKRPRLAEAATLIVASGLAIPTPVVCIGNSWRASGKEKKRWPSTGVARLKSCERRRTR
jgi:hypothetical protein